MSIKLQTTLLSILLFSATVSAQAETSPAVILDIYKGGFKDEYPQVLTRIRSSMLPLQSEVATQFGMQVGQGFRFPVTIRFDDGAPAVNENPYFYVQTQGAGVDFKQVLVVNVEAFAKRSSSASTKEHTHDGSLRYALAELMLNDIAAGDPDKALPLWVQEGLAVYASGRGETFVRETAEREHKSRVGDLIGELNRPDPYLSTKEWALYYLAIKYIATTGGLQAFVRNMTIGKSAADTLRDALSQEWPVFEDHVRLYAREALAAYALSDEDDSTSAHPHH